MDGKDKKMQIKDMVVLGVLNAVFIIIFLIIVMVLGMIPVTSIFAPAIAAIPLGAVFLLLIVKVSKIGAFLISGILQGTVFLLFGVSWPLVSAIVIAAVLGEIIVWGNYKNLKRIASGYAVLICGYSFGSFAPMVFFADAYKVMAVSRGYDESYVNAIIALLNGPVFFWILTASAAGAFLGALFGRRVLKKHFIQAGIV
ncbi:MptD family putative ECF transporter S component [Sporomusa termitida]|uniref:Energy-coupling factor transport system substrate-specific component n=1 Tax=Sporomusa termitida TaxID=2377 RepID=A0A517DR98_9FIRM|nr:MptD family putative ECF transporter S component [Sporomusa termitida]QDR79889.1 hypothetical protein SPTER_11910 [Sporomusa termitida]